jgi:hypothetical protein
MNKADRERVEEIRKTTLLGSPCGFCMDIKGLCNGHFLLSIIDKQDKVVEAAKRHRARSVVTEEAIRILEEGWIG